MRTACIVLLALGVIGCGDRGNSSSLERFRGQWLDAVNRGQYDRLYGLLDASSQRKVSHDLEVLRGLAQPQQRAVIDQLGGTRIENLAQLSPQAYFALLWSRATEGKRPTLVVEADGVESAYMELTVEGAQPQRIRLSIEAGRWVWHLPEQEL